jgi:hypothetical protein
MPRSLHTNDAITLTSPFVTRSQTMRIILTRQDITWQIFRIFAQQQILKHSLKHRHPGEKYCNLQVQKGDDSHQIDYYSR